MGVVKQCHRCQRRVLTEKRGEGEGEGEGERRGSERDRMLRELLTPRPTDWYCFLQYRMTNVARPSVRASPSRSHDYRSRRGHSERSRISTRLSSCNSQEFIIEKGKRSVRSAASVRSFVRRPRNIEFQCGGSPTNLSVRVGVIVVGRVGQGLIHARRSGKAIFWRIWLNIRVCSLDQPR